MPQDLIPTTSKSTTISLREAEARIEVLHGRLEEIPGRPNSFCVRQDRAATTTERRALSAVLNRLEREDAPCTQRDHIDAIITRLLFGFEVGHGGDRERARVLNGEYIEALRQRPLTDPPTYLPLAAVIAAADRFREKRTLLPWKPSYRPMPPEFAAEVREGLVPLRRRIIHARRVLDAEVLPPGRHDLSDARRDEIIADALTKMGPLGERPANEAAMDEAQAEQLARSQADLAALSARLREESEGSGASGAAPPPPVGFQPGSDRPEPSGGGARA